MLTPRESLTRQNSKAKPAALKTAALRQNPTSAAKSQRGAVSLARQPDGDPIQKVNRFNIEFPYGKRVRRYNY
jgi:hypothetical protein